MSCTVSDRKRIQWAAESLRRMIPTVGVDVHEPGMGEYYGWSLEATLSNVESVRSDVLMALVEEDLQLQLAQPRGEHYVVVATA